MGHVATADSGLATVRVVFAELAYLSGRDARKHHAVIENVHSGHLGNAPVSVTIRVGQREAGGLVCA
jgi:hypothetical protein